MAEHRVLFSLTGQLWPDDDDKDYEDDSWDGSVAGSDLDDDEDHGNSKRWTSKKSKNRSINKRKLSETSNNRKTNNKTNNSNSPSNLEETEKKVKTKEEDNPPTSKSGQVPSKNERILLKIRKIKKHSKEKRKCIGEEEYDYQITAQGKPKKAKKPKKQVDFVEDVITHEGPPTATVKLANANTSINPSHLTLKDFFEPVDESYEVQFKLPNEMLVKIFEYVVEDETKAIINLLSLCKVCETWRRLILSSTKLWKIVDLTDFKRRANEQDLVKFSTLLVNTTHLNFTDWEHSLSYPSLSRMLQSCGKNLTSIIFRGCYTIDGTTLDLLSNQCFNLEEIDLSRTTPIDHDNRKKNRKKVHMINRSYPLFPSFQSFLAKNGSKLKSLNLSENRINSLTHVFTAIVKYCPNLQVLDLSNINSSSSFSLRVDQLQESCTNLKILRLGNIFIQPPKAGNCLGFPKLEELSIPCNNSDAGYNESVISSLTKDAENLKLLDIRGSPKITASCIIKIPAWNLQHLAIGHCNTIFSTGLEMIVSKWKHSLIELDISHNLHTEGISAALDALSFEKDSPLAVITLRGSSVLFDSVQKLLINCKKLKLVDLQSCRALPRGTKRVFNEEDVVKLRNDVVNGRYVDFDQ